MFMIFNIDGKQYKLQGVSTGPHKSSNFQHLAIEPEIDLDIPDSLKPEGGVPRQVTLQKNVTPSSDGVGAILSQDDHPVAYFNKGFSPSNRFKSAYDRELLALVLAVAEIKSGLQTDPYTSDIIQKLLSPDSSSVSDFSFVDQFLFYKRRLVIPNISNLKVRLLTGAQEVRLFVQQCLICQQQKYQTLSPAGLLQPLPIPTRIWEDISMDFIVGLPPSGRFDTILVVVDRLSKYAHFICMSHPFTARVVASAFCKEIVRLHGFPRSIVSDRDVVFLSHFWQELFRLTQTKLQLSTSYHPQTDGQIEVINRGLEVTTLFALPFYEQTSGIESSYLPWAEYSYNTGYYTSTGTTPFSVVYGREPPSLLPYVMGETKNAELEQLVERDDMLKLIRHNLHKAQDRMRQQANSKRHDISFEVGDYVFLKIQPYRQRSLAKRRYEKLSPRFFGPYRITRKVGPVAYKLELPPESRIHPIFHDWKIDIGRTAVLSSLGVYESGNWFWNCNLLVVIDLGRKLLGNIMILYTRKKNRVNETIMTQFNSIFGYWLDPLGQSCSWKMEWWGAVYKPISRRQLIRIEDIVQTQASTNEGGSNPPDSVAVQLAAIAAKLETIDVLKADIATPKAQANSRGRSFGSRNDNGGAEKYFRYYHIPDEEKVEVASMHLEGDALNLYAWLSNDELVTFWEELVQAFTKHFGPAEFQNPDEYLCSIKQTDSVQEYRKEFASRSSRVSNWPDHCLLGVFLNGLKEELKSDVRIHKPRTIYNAMSLAIEFEYKVSQSRPRKSSTWTPNLRITAPESKNVATTSLQPSISPKQPPRITDEEKQNRFLKGECFRCGDKYRPGHRCKTGTFKLLEADDVTEEPPDTQEVNLDENPSEVAKISLHAILVNISNGITFGVHIGNGDVIRCSKVCRDLSIQLGGLKVVQDFYPFSIGGADLVLGIQWLAMLNTVQANWKEMFMIFTIDGK
ncbi:putative nucleotidyltransferase, ribonuclease H [Tanacetum coccineum]